MESKIPEREGQICKILHPMADEDPADVYIIAEDPAPFDDDDNIYVVSLNDLQRNINDPQSCQQISVAKNDLDVIADSLETYIDTWNQ